MTARLAVIAVLAGCHLGAPRAEAVRNAVVERGDIVDRVILTGTLRPTEAVDLVVPVSEEWAPEIRWLVADGARVKAGDRVAELGGGSLTGKLADDRGQLETAEAQFRAAQSTAAEQLAEKAAAVRQREIERDRVRLRAELPADLVTARAAHEAELALTRAEGELRKAERELAAQTREIALEDRVKRIELEKTRRTTSAAEQAIGAMVITAPRDGIAVIDERPEDGRKYRAGDTVQQGMAIVSLPDLTRPMEVRADLIDVDDGRVDLDMAGTCTLDAYPADPVACTVADLAPIARPKLGRDALRRAYEVTLVLGRGDPAHLRPGMSVKVELDRRIAGALVVPRGAVIRGERDRVRLDSGELREVAVRACDAQRCAIASGVAGGDAVVIGGPS